MRLVFMGTPEFAVPVLEALIDAGHEMAAVYTQPPRPAGRGKAPSPSPVQRRARSAGLEVRTPASLKDADEQARFAELDAEAAVVAAYGLILPPPLLSAPRSGCLNVHASLLPRWRGAAPIQRAILAGDKETGVSLMKMERGLDTGPVYATRTTRIAGRTAGELGEELARIGAEMMVELLARIDDARAVPQPEFGATYAPKVEKQETRLDFARPAVEVERQVRAFNPPGVWFEHEGERIRVLSAGLSELSGEPGTVLDHGLAIACAEGSIVPGMVQRAGKQPMATAELLRGFVIPAGTRL